MYTQNENDSAIASKEEPVRNCFMPVQKTPPKVIRTAEPRGPMRMDPIRKMPFYGKSLDEIDNRTSENSPENHTMKFV